jgi:hypothetical protein
VGVDLPAQDGVLVAQQQDLGGLGGVIAVEDGEPGELLPQDQIDENQCHAWSTMNLPSRITGINWQVSGTDVSSRHPHGSPTDHVATGLTTGAKAYRCSRSVRAWAIVGVAAVVVIPRP